MKILEIITGQAQQGTPEENNVVELLCSAAARPGKLTDTVAGKSIQLQIEEVFYNQCTASIERLLKCIPHEGEIASFITKCAIEALSASHSDYAFAANIRTQAQSIILGQNHADNTSKNPEYARLLLLAGATLDDAPDTLPPLIRSFIRKTEKQSCKPLWWVDSPSKEGCFSVASLERIAQNYEFTDYNVKAYNVARDKVSAYRCHLALALKNLYWLKGASQNEVLKAVEKNKMGDYIKEAALGEHERSELIAPADYFSQPSFEIPKHEHVLNKLMSMNGLVFNGKTTLSPLGIAAVLKNTETLSWHEYQSVIQELPHNEWATKETNISGNFPDLLPKHQKASLIQGAVNFLNFSTWSLPAPAPSAVNIEHRSAKTGEHNTTFNSTPQPSSQNFASESMSTWLSWGINGGYDLVKWADGALDKAIKSIIPISEVGAMPVTHKPTDNTAHRVSPEIIQAWLMNKLRHTSENSANSPFPLNKDIANSIQAVLDGKKTLGLLDDWDEAVGIDTPTGVVVISLDSDFIGLTRTLNLVPSSTSIGEQLASVLPAWSQSLRDRISQEIQHHINEPEFLVANIIQDIRKNGSAGEFSPSSLQAIEKHLENSAKTNQILLELSPLDYLKEKIKSEIAAYEKANKVNLNLTPDSNILLTTHEDVPLPYLGGSTKKTNHHNVPLSIFLSGSTDLITKSLALDFESEHLERFAMGARKKLRELGQEMHQNVEKIRSTTALRANLTNAYTGNIVSHCLQLLNESGIDTESKNTITRFLNGELKASVISINGTPVSNVFLLGKTSSLTLYKPYYERYENVPEGLFISLNSKNTYRFSINRSGDTSPSGYHHHLDNPKFKEFLCENTSTRDSKSCSDNLGLHAAESNPLGKRRKASATIRIMRRYKTPLEFKEMSGLRELADALADNTLTNTGSNIDFLFYSQRERNTDLALAILKHILATASIPTGLISMLPFGLTGTITAAAANGFIGGGIIGIDTYRYIQDKGTEREKEALEDLVMSSVFGLISGSAALKPLKAKWLMSIYSKAKSSTPKIIKHLSKAAETKTNKASIKQLKTPIANTPTKHEPIREIISSQPEIKLPPTLSNYRSDIDKIPSLSRMVNNPKENCFNILDETKKYMIDKGMTDIRVRGMYIWQKPDDIMPSNHYVLLGKMGDMEYVFDLTAGQFPKIDGPLVLPKLAWERIYQQTWPSKLIKYGDFSAPKRAEIAFSSSLPKNPVEFMTDTIILAKPNWYLKGTPLDSVRKVMP
ncbi:hypothetical protein P5705_22630 [Pseudomonas entomophila]|uniref:hypothetical protein n=1 Tax=Pseudomonas entomophila TaxID=312306 RepID=UPI0024060183|nr:hypothetical protein [Pseudomonas entomophila]MDF9620453.1 hypothetical protein [Pseudomonas entomophila]